MTIHYIHSPARTQPTNHQPPSLYKQSRSTIQVPKIITYPPSSPLISQASNPRTRVRKVVQGSNSKPHQPNYQPTNSHTLTTFPTSHSFHPFSANPPPNQPPQLLPTKVPNPPLLHPPPGSRFLRSLQTSSTPRAIRQPRRPRRRVSGSLHSPTTPTGTCLPIWPRSILYAAPFSFSFPSLLFLLSSFLSLRFSHQFPLRSDMHMLRGTMQRRIARRDHRRDHP